MSFLEKLRKFFRCLGKFSFYLRIIYRRMFRKNAIFTDFEEEKKGRISNSSFYDLNYHYESSENSEKRRGIIQPRSVHNSIG